MLQNIRENFQGLMAKVIITIMIIPFAFFGVQSLLGSGGGQLNVASVNGEDISAFELERAIVSQKNRLLSMMGENADPALLNDDLLKKPALDQIIQTSLLLQLASSSSLDISPATIDQSILAMKQFQIEGKFSPQAYQNILRSGGYNPAFFKEMLRDDMVINQLNTGLAGSNFSSEKDVAEVSKIVAQKRTYRYLTVPLATVSDAISIPDVDIKAYYKKNAEQFQSEDRVKLAYIDLTISDFFEPVTENSIREAYDRENKDFVAGSERRASHILIEINDNRDEQQAKEKITEIQQKLAEGASFSDLANEFSEDAGSAQAQGDLGFTRGDTFPESFEQALFELDLNAVSKPVLTDSGYHLIMATAVNDVEAPAYEERKPLLEMRLQQDQARGKIVTTVEELKDLVFNAEDLKEPADQLNLTLSHSEWISRNDVPELLSSAQVMAAAYSSDVIDDGNNSDVIELDQNHYIVVRVTDHDEPHTKELEQVREEISSLLAKEASIEKAQQIAGEVVAGLSEKSMADIAKETEYSWEVQLNTTRNKPTNNREVQQLAFQMHELSNGSRTEVKTLRNGDVIIITLEAVVDGELSDLSRVEQLSLSSEIQKNYATQSFNVFLQSQRLEADVQIF